MKFTDEEGKVWEWRGEYRYPLRGERFLPANSEDAVLCAEYDWGAGNIRAIVHPVPTIHEFGGVKFEETGEVRCARVGEWYVQLYSECEHLRFNSDKESTALHYRILRPCQGE